MHEMFSLIFFQVLCGAFSFDLQLKLVDFSIYQSVIASVPSGFFCACGITLSFSLSVSRLTDTYLPKALSILRCMIYGPRRRKPVFRVSDKASFKPVYSAKETS